jgi:curved DNA-binding protein CbpA
LTRGATQTEIKDAYRVLAKVWHPDRFEGDESLRQKAEEKLKEINSAYQRLTRVEDKGAYRPSSRPASPAEEVHQPSAAASEGYSYRGPSARPYSPPIPMRRRVSRKWLAIPVVILIAGGAWAALRYVNPTSWEFWNAATTDTSAAPQRDSPAEISGKGARAGANGRSSKGTPGTNGSAVPAETMEAHTRTKAVSAGASLVEYPSDDPLVPYFTVGSTRDDVIRVQGTPDKVTAGVFGYGLSQVYFRNGRVNSWHSDPGTPLKARMPQ